MYMTLCMSNVEASNNSITVLPSLILNYIATPSTFRLESIMLKNLSIIIPSRA